MKVLRFNNNRIHYVATLAFYNLKNLAILDLSHNMIQMINSDIFLSCPKLEALILQNYTAESNAYNSLFEVTIKILQTDDFLLCCAINEQTYCMAQSPWYFTCTDLLPDKSIQVSFCFIPITTIILSGCSMITQFLKQNNLGNGVPKHAQTQRKPLAYWIQLMEFIFSYYIQWTINTRELFVLINLHANPASCVLLVLPLYLIIIYFHLFCSALFHFQDLRLLLTQ